MAQFNWLYLGDNGRQYNVGLFHGDRTGHLMVMCNARIVLIDFSVKQAKDYSFFIDDELFELSVEGNPGGYAYNCSINEEADTPRNRVRKKQKKLDFRKTIALITVFTVVMIGVLGFAMVNQKGEPPPVNQEALLNQKGLETIARVYIAEKTGPSEIEYSFVADGRAKNYEQEWSGELINGFPLVSGDEFKILYLPARPGNHRLDFERPTLRQIDRYLDRTLKQHLSLNSELSRAQALCQVKIAYRLGGIPGLAVFFNQDKPVSENADYNELIYKKLTRDVPFQEAVEKECW